MFLRPEEMVDLLRTAGLSVQISVWTVTLIWNRCLNLFYLADSNHRVSSSVELALCKYSNKTIWIKIEIFSNTTGVIVLDCEKWSRVWPQFVNSFSFFARGQILGCSWIDLVNEWMHVIPPRPSSSRGERASPGVAEAQPQLITARVTTARARLWLAWDRQLPPTTSPSPRPPLSAVFVSYYTRRVPHPLFLHAVACKSCLTVIRRETHL